MSRITVAEYEQAEAERWRAYLLDALERNAWSITSTARDIETTIPRLQRAIAASPELRELYATRAPSGGRPGKPRTRRAE